MSERESKGFKGQFSALVDYNSRFSEGIYRLGLLFEGAAAETFSRTQAGQFAQFDLSNCPLPAAGDIPAELADSSERKLLLRRPFSFSKVEKVADKVEVEIVYCVVGPSTIRMTALRQGDCVSAIGPLGRGFWLPRGKTSALLVSGGMGSPPLQHLTETLAKDHSDIQVVVFAGARSKEQFCFDIAGLRKSVSELFVATDDGSAGYHGFVTEVVDRWLVENKPVKESCVLYACGPEVMLAAVSRIAENTGIDCQLSMERRMACGIGLCQGCAVECKVAGTDETVYKMCCKDGPVFESSEVVF